MKNYTSISEYNESLGIPTEHPLISVIDLSQAHPISHQRHTMDFYCIYLKEVKCGNVIYGCNYYDYQEGSAIFLAPGQVIGVEDNGEIFTPKGYALMFHPDLLTGTPLAHIMHDYSFFSYEVNEALHLSEKEREIFMHGLESIKKEICSTIDKYTKRLICSEISILLDHCMRFYDRQFITREKVSNDLVSRFEKLVQNYIHSDLPRKAGILSVKYCSSELCLSQNYFSDLIKKYTGKTPKEYIDLQVLTEAKVLLQNQEMTISEISDYLGFQYLQHFSRFFKKAEGISPMQYRLKKIS